MVDFPAERSERFEAAAGGRAIDLFPDAEQMFVCSFSKSSKSTEEEECRGFSFFEWAHHVLELYCLFEWRGSETWRLIKF